jgi:hypothetical protein
MKHVSHRAKKLGFYIHAAAFVIGMALLVVINLLTGPPFWVLWVLLGWSIGIVSHGLCVLIPAAARTENT